MNSACEICRGACCEGIILPWIAEPDEDLWLSFHGESVMGGTHIPCKCNKLEDGRCSIWMKRPELCRRYPVGGVQCRETIRLLRPATKDLIESKLES